MALDAERGAKDFLDSVEPVADVIKLVLGLSTGAIAIFVHVVVEGHATAVPTFFLMSLRSVSVPLQCRASGL
jgi:hypothetical protein